MADIDDIWDDEEDLAPFTKTKVETIPLKVAPLMRNVRPVRVEEWPKKTGERVLLWVEHSNLQFATGEDRDDWRGWFTGYWTERSVHWPHGHGEGWVWNGMSGTITHVAPLPPAPEVGR